MEVVGVSTLTKGGKVRYDNRMLALRSRVQLRRKGFNNRRNS